MGEKRMMLITNSCMDLYISQGMHVTSVKLRTLITCEIIKYQAFFFSDKTKTYKITRFATKRNPAISRASLC